MAAFDAALAGSAQQRPLSVAAAALLGHAVTAVGAEHGYIRVGTKDGAAPQATAGRGIWAYDVPEDLAEEVVVSGRPRSRVTEAGGAEHRWLAVPVMVDGEVVGSLGVALDEPADDDDARHVAVLERFADLVAVAYAGARLITTERTAREQEKALIRAGQALSSTLELETVLNRILTELRKVVPYDTASVQEYRDNQMVIVGGNGIDMEVFGGVGFDARGDGVPNGDVLRRRAPVIVADILGDHPYHDFPHDAHEMSGVRGWLGVPLLFADECIGMLTLDTFEPDFYTDDHADTALAFAAQAAIALVNARSFAVARREVEERRRAEADLRQANSDLRERMGEIETLQADLREQAVRDALTGLHNRRHLMEVLEDEVARALACGSPLALALIDVDHFKNVNDTRGHAAGDLVLRAVADRLAADRRDGEVACRYGGEEFVVLMPDTGLEEAAVRAERWRCAISGAAPEHTDRRSGTQGVTASIGVAAFEPVGPRGRPDDGDSLIRRADAAMYRAKAEGRDRVVCAGSSDPVRDQAERASWAYG